MLVMGRAMSSVRLGVCLVLAVCLFVASAEAELSCSMAGKWQATVEDGQNMFASYNGTTTYDFSSSGSFSVEAEVESSYSADNVTLTQCDFTYTTNGNFLLNVTYLSTNLTSCEYTDCNDNCQFLCDNDCDPTVVWVGGNQNLTFADHCKSFTTESGVTFHRLQDWFWLITVSVGAAVVLLLAVGIVAFMWVKKKKAASPSTAYIDITDG